MTAVWKVNCAAGIALTQSFSMSAFTSSYQLNIYNQNSAGTYISVTASTVNVTTSKLNLYSVTSGGSSNINGAAVTLGTGE